MTRPLERLRSTCNGLPDAIRWACVLEATAPKAGNVYPGQSFDDLNYRDFVAAAEITAVEFAERPSRFSRAAERICERVASEIGTNVNLGIVLMIGPLVQAAAPHDAPLPRDQWQASVEKVLQGLDDEDAFRLYDAINAAGPGGMGRRKDMDLSGPPPASFLDAMHVARSQDRIAANYCAGFEDLFHHVVPVLSEQITRAGDVLSGIASAHLELLSANVDSLISRKFGPELAGDVQQRAEEAKADPRKVARFDAFLRGDNPRGLRFNPGTTADLLAAALFVLLAEADS